MSLSRLLAPLCAAFLGLVSAASANPLDAIHDDDREALEALAVYPEDVRNDALEVATEPGLLVELQDLQDDSQQTFRDLLDPYSQSDQEQLFELSRYPELVEAIARGGPKGRGELEQIARDYPEDVRDAVVRQGGEHHRVVTRMHALLEDFDHRFAELIDDLAPPKQRAFRTLLGTPELLSLMNEHTQMTVLLGDAYERDPGDVREALADLNLEVARRNAEEADDWKRTVDSDPELRRDYDAAAADYRRDTGYDAYQAPSRTVVNVSVNPYPYWFGYPWWYPVSYTYYDPWYWWYPRRTWAHCGYSYGPRVAFYGGGPLWRPFYPSYHFTSWYFSFGHHHHRYPYLSDRFVSYYQRPVVINNYHYNHRRRVVRKFVHETHYVMPAGYWKGKNRGERVERFREYGRIAPQIERVRGQNRLKDFEKGGKRGPGRDFTLRDRGGDDRVSREEARKLVAKNPKQFPELAKVKKEDWDRPRERDRSGDVDRGKRGGGPDVGREPGGKRDARPGPALGEPKGDAGKGRARPAQPDAGKGRARPSAEPDAGKGRARPSAKPDAGKDRAKERPADAGSRGKRDSDGGSGKARPSLERPGGEKPGTSGDRGRDVERRGGDSGAKATGKGSGGQGSGGGSPKRSGKETKAAPSFDAPSSSSRERSQPKAERRSSEPRKAQPSSTEPRRERQAAPKPKQEAPRVRQAAPKQEAPRVRQQESAPRRQEPRAETPRVQRESRGGNGGGERQGGGGNGGGKKGKNAEEEGQGGGGGGGGGKRGR